MQSLQKEKTAQKIELQAKTNVHETRILTDETVYGIPSHRYMKKEANRSYKASESTNEYE